MMFMCALSLGLPRRGLVAPLDKYPRAYETDSAIFMYESFIHFQWAIVAIRQQENLHYWYLKFGAAYRITQGKLVGYESFFLL